MTKRRCLKIIQGLRRFNAVILVVWHGECEYPRLWLKDWCGVRTSVSIATAEMILKDIIAGTLVPVDVILRPVRSKLRPPISDIYVETMFVR